MGSPVDNGKDRLAVRRGVLEEYPIDLLLGRGRLLVQMQLIQFPNRVWKRDHPDGVKQGAGKWWRGQDSNLRPLGYEPNELPLLHPAPIAAVG